MTVKVYHTQNGTANTTLYLHEIPAANHLWENQSRHREDFEAIMRNEAEACPDHIHMLVSIPPSLSVLQFMGYLKGKSPLMIFDRHANLKYKHGNRHFWYRGYYINTVGRNSDGGSNIFQGVHRPIYG